MFHCPGNFSLSSLGTYNCDQLQKLEDPIKLYVQYKNSKGQEIKPVIAFLFDSKINGLMRYDGNYGLSPYYIAYSPKSTSRMVLIDKEGEAFLVKPEIFAAVDTRQLNGVFTFTAEPISKAKNKEDLRTKLSL
jgi:hypothetical protein